MDINETAEQFHLSLRAEDWLWLKRRGLSSETIKGQKLGYVSEGRFRDSISIPYFNPDLTVRSIRFRYLNPVRQKYDNMKGQSIHLFNVANTNLPKVWICEGEFDAMILSQLGCPAVGTPGASGFKPDWKYLFVNCEQVSLVFDGDDAGERGANRLASILGDVFKGDMRSIRLPKSMDVTDYYLKNPTELKELVA